MEKTAGEKWEELVACARVLVCRWNDARGKDHRAVADRSVLSLVLPSRAYVTMWCPAWRCTALHYTLSVRINRAYDIV